MTIEDFKDVYKGKTPLEMLKLLIVQTDYIRDDVRSMERDRINGNEKDAEYMRSEIRAKEDRIQWLYDQLAPVLKAQETRVLTLEEIHGRMHVWLEYIEKNEVVLAIGGDSCGGAKCFITEYDESVALKDRQYNIRWRAWTQRPTRAQMEATPWHSEERAGE